MPQTLEDFLMTRQPTAERPLLGQTILVVEDSRYVCEALRMICQRSGARIRRADSLRSAERHLRTYRPGIVLVDLGLPDGSGLELIRALSPGEEDYPVVIAMSGDDAKADAAKSAGARAFLAKPINSVSAFQAAILAEMPREARPAGLRPVTSDAVIPDRIALRDDLALADELLSDNPTNETLEYVSGFLRGLAKASDDSALADAARALRAGHGATGARARLQNLLRERLKAEQPV